MYYIKIQSSLTIVMRIRRVIPSKCAQIKSNITIDKEISLNAKVTRIKILYSQIFELKNLIYSK